MDIGHSQNENIVRVVFVGVTKTVTIRPRRREAL